jgi:two-component system cell cycle sensor histidine kinase/response regulator CckA
MNFFRDTLAPRTSANLISLLTERRSSAEPTQESAHLQEIGAQAAKIAHDLNNLLSPILMALEIFRPQLEEASHLAILDIARKSTLRAADLVKQILTFARGANEERHEIDPGVVVQEIAAFAQATFPRSMDVEVHAAENLAPIVGNATQLHRALLNLCINARDAMPEGGTLTLRAANVSFDAPNIRMPRGARRGRYVLFEVSDTGSGIPAAIREKIFDPFFTTKGAGKGTGLGLASVRSIVESHAGLLSLQTEMGKGTTFHLLIPASEDGQTAKPAAAEIRIVPE